MTSSACGLPPHYGSHHRIGCPPSAVMLMRFTPSSLLWLLTLMILTSGGSTLAANPYSCTEGATGNGCVASAFREKYQDSAIFISRVIQATAPAGSSTIIEWPALPPYCGFVDISLSLPPRAVSGSQTTTLMGAGLYPHDAPLGEAAWHAGLVVLTGGTVVVRVLYVGLRGTFYSLTNNSISSGALIVPSNGALLLPAVQLLLPSQPSAAAMSVDPTCLRDYITNRSTPIALPYAWRSSLAVDIARMRRARIGGRAAASHYLRTSFLESWKNSMRTSGVVGSGVFDASGSDVFAAFWMSAASHPAWIAKLYFEAVATSGAVISQTAAALLNQSSTINRNSSGAGGNTPLELDLWRISQPAAFTQEGAWPSDEEMVGGDGLVVAPMLWLDDVGDAPYFVSSSIASAASESGNVPRLFQTAASDVPARAFTFRWSTAQGGRPSSLVAAGLLPSRHPSVFENRFFRPVNHTDDNEPSAIRAFSVVRDYWFPVLIGVAKSVADISAVGMGLFEANSTDVMSAAVLRRLTCFSSWLNTSITPGGIQALNRAATSDDVTAPTAPELLYHWQPSHPEFDSSSVDTLPPLSVVLVRLSGIRAMMHRGFQVGVETTYRNAPVLTFAVIGVSSIRDLLSAAMTTTSAAMYDAVASGVYGENVTMVPSMALETLTARPITGTGIYTTATDIGAAAFHNGRVVNLGQTRDVFLHFVAWRCPIVFYANAYLGLRSGFADFSSPKRSPPTSPPRPPGCFTVASVPIVPRAMTRLEPRRVVLRLTHSPYDLLGYEQRVGSGVYPVLDGMEMSSYAFLAGVIEHNQETQIFVHYSNTTRRFFLGRSHRGIITINREYSDENAPAAVFFSRNENLSPLEAEALWDENIALHTVTPLPLIAKVTPASSGRGVVGMGYYTCDSDVAVAALHATLVPRIGGNATVVSYIIGYRSRFFAGYSNGVYSGNYDRATPAYVLMGEARASRLIETLRQRFFDKIRLPPDSENLVVGKSNVATSFAAGMMAFGATSERPLTSLLAIFLRRWTTLMYPDWESDPSAANRTVTATVKADTSHNSVFGEVLGSGIVAWASDITSAAWQSYFISESDEPQRIAYRPLAAPSSSSEASSSMRRCFPASRPPHYGSTSAIFYGQGRLGLVVHAPPRRTEAEDDELLLNSVFQSLDAITEESPLSVMEIRIVRAIDDLAGAVSAEWTGVSPWPTTLETNASVNETIQLAASDENYAYDGDVREFVRAVLQIRSTSEIVVRLRYISHHLFEPTNGAVYYHYQDELSRAAAHAGLIELNDPKPRLIRLHCLVPPGETATATDVEQYYYGMYNNSIASSSYIGRSTPSYYFVTGTVADLINEVLRSQLNLAPLYVAVPFVDTWLPAGYSSDAPVIRGTTVYALSSELTQAALHAGLLQWNGTRVLLIRARRAPPSVGFPPIPGTTSFLGITSMATTGDAEMLFQFLPVEASTASLWFGNLSRDDARTNLSLAEWVRQLVDEPPWPYDDQRHILTLRVQGRMNPDSTACSGAGFLVCRSTGNIALNAVQHGWLRLGVINTLYVHYFYVNGVGAKTTTMAFFGGYDNAWKDVPWLVVGGVSSFGVVSPSVAVETARTTAVLILSNSTARPWHWCTNASTGAPCGWASLSAAVAAGANESARPFPILDVESILFADVYVSMVTPPGAELVEGSPLGYSTASDITWAALHMGLITYAEGYEPATASHDACATGPPCPQPPLPKLRPTRIWYRAMRLDPPRPLLGSTGFNGITSRSTSDAKSFVLILTLNPNNTAFRHPTQRLGLRRCGPDISTGVDDDANVDVAALNLGDPSGEADYLRDILGVPHAYASTLADDDGHVSCELVPYPFDQLSFRATWTAMGLHAYSQVVDVTVAAFHSGLYHEADAVEYVHDQLLQDPESGMNITSAYGRRRRAIVVDGELIGGRRGTSFLRVVLRRWIQTELLRLIDLMNMIGLRLVHHSVPPGGLRDVPVAVYAVDLPLSPCAPRLSMIRSPPGAPFNQTIFRLKCVQPSWSEEQASTFGEVVLLSRSVDVMAGRDFSQYRDTTEIYVFHPGWVKHFERENGRPFASPTMPTEPFPVCARCFQGVHRFTVNYNGRISVFGAGVYDSSTQIPLAAWHDFKLPASEEGSTGFASDWTLPLGATTTAASPFRRLLSEDDEPSSAAPASSGGRRASAITRSIPILFEDPPPELLLGWPFASLIQNGLSGNSYYRDQGQSSVLRSVLSNESIRYRAIGGDMFQRTPATAIIRSVTLRRPWLFEVGNMKCEGTGIYSIEGTEITCAARHGGLLDLWNVTQKELTIELHMQAPTDPFGGKSILVGSTRFGVLSANRPSQNEQTTTMSVWNASKGAELSRVAKRCGGDSGSSYVIDVDATLTVANPYVPIWCRYYADSGGSSTTGGKYLVDGVPLNVAAADSGVLTMNGTAIATDRRQQVPRQRQLIRFTLIPAAQDTAPIGAPSPTSECSRMNRAGGYPRPEYGYVVERAAASTGSAGQYCGSDRPPTMAPFTPADPSGPPQCVGSCFNLLFPNPQAAALNSVVAFSVVPECSSLGGTVVGTLVYEYASHVSAAACHAGLNVQEGQWVILYAVWKGRRLAFPGSFSNGVQSASSGVEGYGVLIIRDSPLPGQQTFESPAFTSLRPDELRDNSQGYNNVSRMVDDRPDVLGPIPAALLDFRQSNVDRICYGAGIFHVGLTLLNAAAYVSGVSGPHVRDNATLYVHLVPPRAKFFRISMGIIACSELLDPKYLPGVGMYISFSRNPDLGRNGTRHTRVVVTRWEMALSRVDTQVYGISYHHVDSDVQSVTRLRGFFVDKTNNTLGLPSFLRPLNSIEGRLLGEDGLNALYITPSERRYRVVVDVHHDMGKARAFAGIAYGVLARSRSEIQQTFAITHAGAPRPMELTLPDQAIPVTMIGADQDASVISSSVRGVPGFFTTDSCVFQAALVSGLVRLTSMQAVTFYVHRVARLNAELQAPAAYYHYAKLSSAESSGMEFMYVTSTPIRDARIDADPPGVVSWFAESTIVAGRVPWCLAGSPYLFGTGLYWANSDVILSAIHDGSVVVGLPSPPALIPDPSASGGRAMMVRRHEPRVIDGSTSVIKIYMLSATDVALPATISNGLRSWPIGPRARAFTFRVELLGQLQRDRSLSVTVTLPWNLPYLDPRPRGVAVFNFESFVSSSVLIENPALLPPYAFVVRPRMVPGKIDETFTDHQRSSDERGGMMALDPARTSTTSDNWSTTLTETEAAVHRLVVRIVCIGLAVSISTSTPIYVANAPWGRHSRVGTRPGYDPESHFRRRRHTGLHHTGGHERDQFNIRGFPDALELASLSACDVVGIVGPPTAFVV